MATTVTIPDHPIIESAWEYRLAELRYFIEPPDGGEPYIEITLVKGAEKRRFRFWSPQNVYMQEGFCTQSYVGLQILDVSRRQLEDISVQVSCFENIPGFGFYARSVEEWPVQSID